MQTRTEQVSASALPALLTDGALAGDWLLDPRRSTIRLKTKVVGLIPVSGVFRDVSGHGTVSRDGEVSGTVVVAAASVDTRIGRRDTHLRSADIFNVAQHPYITFTADAVRPAGNGVAVTGTLTVRDRSRPLAFHSAASVQGDGQITLDAETHINRADFGLTWKPNNGASMIITLTIHAVFARR
jgi:polyisoprenoid-binding protein YceI